MSWYCKDKEEAQAVIENDEKEREALHNTPQRFWIKKDTAVKVTFLDYENPKDYPFPLVFKEHSVQVNGKWTSFTCIQGEPHSKTGKPMVCPLCAGGNRPTLSAAYSVVDHSEYQGKKKLYKDELKLYIAKTTTHKLLQNQYAKRGELRGLMYEVSRLGTDSPGSGNSFDLERRWVSDEEFSTFTKGKYKGLPEPAKYLELLKPLDEEVLKRRLVGVSEKAEVIPYDSNVAAGADDDQWEDDIPF